MSNVPAVRQEDGEPSREIAKADTDSWIGVVGEVAKFAGYIAGTEFVPKSLRDSPAAATAAIMYGREVGLPPMTALTQTHVIEGKPSLSAEAMRALVLAAGHDIEVLESTGAICRMRAKRRGSERWSSEVIWTIDMARAAGLLGKKNWQNYPRQMLSARTSAELCTLHFPDVTLGFRSLEELEDLDGEEVGPAEALTSTTRVTRKRATTKKPAALPAPEKPAERPQAPAGPPLPGEDGYESPGGEDGGSAPESVELPHDAPHPESEQADESDESSQEDGNTEGPPADVVDADPVDESPAASVGDGSGEGGAAAAHTGDGSPGEAGLPDPQPASPPSSRKASRAQLRMLEASLTQRGIDAKDREERHLIASKILGREVESFNELSTPDATTVIDTLARTENREQLWALLDAIDEGGQS